MTVTDPTHLGPWHQLAIRAGDNATKAVLHVVAKRVVLRASFSPAFGRLARRSACHRAVVARYLRPPLRVAALPGATHVRSSTVNGPGGGRSHAPHTYGPEEQRSLLAQQRTGSTPTPDPRRSAVIPPDWRNHLDPTAGDPQPRQPHPHSKHHQRPPPKTGPDSHAALSTADQATNIWQGYKV